MLKKDMSDLEKQEAKNTVLWSMDIFLKYYVGATERAIKALFLTNGGGVITMLAYLHSSFTKCWWLSIALIFFVFGLSCAFAAVITDFEVSRLDLKKYVENVKKFNKSEITFHEAQNISSSKVPKALVVGYISVAFFAIGLIFGMIGYFCSCAQMYGS